MKKKYFSETFIASLPDDQFEAYRGICKEFFQWETSLKSGPGNEAHYAEYLEVYAFLRSFMDAHPIPIRLPAPTFRVAKDITSLQKVFETIVVYIEDQIRTHHLKEVYSQAMERFPALLPGGFAYELSDASVQQMCKLLDELRALVYENELLDYDYKGRLSKKVDKLRNSVEPRMASLDQFWGLVGDSGILASKYGKGTRLISDKVRQIMTIVVQTQSDSEKVPDDSQNPLLSIVKEGANSPDEYL